MNELNRINSSMKDMNILPGQRISWETRGIFTDRLATFAAEGYLTEEEWEARRNWVLSAKTMEEAEVAFRDLPYARVVGRPPVKPVTRTAMLTRGMKLALLLPYLTLIATLIVHIVW